MSKHRQEESPYAAARLTGLVLQVVAFCRPCRGLVKFVYAPEGSLAATCLVCPVFLRLSAEFDSQDPQIAGARPAAPFAREISFAGQLKGYFVVT